MALFQDRGSLFLVLLNHQFRGCSSSWICDDAFAALAWMCSLADSGILQSEFKGHFEVGRLVRILLLGHFSYRSYNIKEEGRPLQKIRVASNYSQWSYGQYQPKNQDLQCVCVEEQGLVGRIEGQTFSIFHVHVLQQWAKVTRTFPWTTYWFLPPPVEPTTGYTVFGRVINILVNLATINKKNMGHHYSKSVGDKGDPIVSGCSLLTRRLKGFHET